MASGDVRPRGPAAGPCASSAGAKRIAILGSTGSIGAAALEVAAGLGAEVQVVGLAARASADKLARQAARFKAKWVCAFEPEAAKALEAAVPPGTKVLPPGVPGLLELAVHPEVDLVLTSLVGSVGFAPLLAAIKAGKTVAVANKEPLVMAGPALMQEAERWRATLIPVDSEPSAVFQCLIGASRPGLSDDGWLNLAGLGRSVRKVLLTASGGPFYRRRGGLDRVTVREALAHPRWRMGPKITVDSATLMNKGFEAIEIQNLFGLKPAQVEILIHPQSIVHSAVELEDGSVLAQLSPPDMRLPIQLALTWPERRPGPVPRLDLAAAGRLDFERPDLRRFPCLALAREAARLGGSVPAVLSAADESAVEAFLAGAIRFTDIPRVIERVLAAHTSFASPSLADIVEIDAWARAESSAALARLRPPPRSAPGFRAPRPGKGLRPRRVLA